MSISVIKNRLAETALTVLGIKRAYANAPQGLPDADLPLVCIFTGSATYRAPGDSLAEEMRAYILRLFVVPIQAGYDGEAEQKVEPFLTSFRDTYLSHPMLGAGTVDSSLPFVIRATWVGDGGVSVLPFAGASYLGAEFRINVVSIVPIEIAHFE